VFCLHSDACFPKNLNFFNPFTGCFDLPKRKCLRLSKIFFIKIFVTLIIRDEMLFYQIDLVFSIIPFTNLKSVQSLHKYSVTVWKGGTKYIGLKQNDILCNSISYFLKTFRLLLHIIPRIIRNIFQSKNLIEK
jgi:hypothetical protein